MQRRVRQNNFPYVGHAPKNEERGRNHPPSRHLWVGNLPHGIPERELADLFLRFGELDSVAFQPGRSYAFLNFKHDQDAFSAFDSLQGFPLSGNPLRIEFTKADKSSTGSHTEAVFHHDEQQRRPVARRSPYLQHESRTRYESPDAYRKPKMGDRNAEASEVLYIGFPVSLKLDETILRKVFSAFGELSKVSVFPGRSFAFVQFRNLMAACKAKETLQGNLFGNPRVHISFAKSEPSSSNSGRGPSSRSFSPPYRTTDRLGSSEAYFQDRNYEDIDRDHNYIADRDFEHSEDYIFNRKRTSRNDGTLRSTHRLPQDYHASPRDMGSTFHVDPHRFPSRSSEPWGLPEEENYYQESKRVRTERQPPGYTFSAREQERHPFSRASADFERSSLREPHAELMGGGYSLPSTVPERKRYTPELNRPSIKDWNWEGTIAKGGSPICRAKCFPVGKVMDMMLPEFLDCTARTGLDMLAKHYYQSSEAWVVFFVPGSDADIVFYNEFMHYLEEKQRAAVSKLDDTTTLFLVPPSDFSEKVLKVPGKLSISGVILRLEQGGSVPQQDPDLLTYYGKTSYSEASGASYPDVGNTRPLPAFLHRDGQSAPIDPYTKSKNDQLNHQYSEMEWPPNTQPFVEHHNTVQENVRFVPRKQPNPYQETETPIQLTHINNTPNQHERYAHSQQAQTPSNIARLVSSGNQNVEQIQIQQGGSISQEDKETEDNPQHRLQATLQLAAALLQQIQQGKN
ncbi:unnamed protein product [Cochlearia groenlandica]